MDDSLQNDSFKPSSTTPIDICELNCFDYQELDPQNDEVEVLVINNSTSSPHYDDIDLDEQEEIEIGSCNLRMLPMNSKLKLLKITLLRV